MKIRNRPAKVHSKIAAVDCNVLHLGVNGLPFDEHEYMRPNILAKTRMERMMKRILRMKLECLRFCSQRLTLKPITLKMAHMIAEKANVRVNTQWRVSWLTESKIERRIRVAEAMSPNRKARTSAHVRVLRTTRGALAYPVGVLCL